MSIQIVDCRYPQSWSINLHLECCCCNRSSCSACLPFNSLISISRSFMRSPARSQASSAFCIQYSDVVVLSLQTHCFTAVKDMGLCVARADGPALCVKPSQETSSPQFEAMIHLRSAIILCYTPQLVCSVADRQSACSRLFLMKAGQDDAQVA